MGKPIQGTQIFLLDQHQQPVPPLARGELYIAGLGVSQGYCQKPQETSERYIDLKIVDKTFRVYRTGDFARLNHNNEYEYLGRADQQIKIHGFRVEVDEIINAIQLIHSIKQAFVMGHMTTTGQQELVAYLVYNEGEKVTTDQLRNELSKSLPDYMIPHYYINLTSLPLNQNGKIDKHALPLPERNIFIKSFEYQSVMEKEIAQCWQELLPKSDFDRLSNFFYIGGHSLLAARLVAKFKCKFSVDFTLEDIFSYSTITEQAKKIEDYLKKNDSQMMSFVKLDRPQEIPLSFSQQRLWYLQHAEGKTPISNIPIVIKIQGQLNIPALEESINYIIQRHEILRTVYESVIVIFATYCEIS